MRAPGPQLMSRLQLWANSDFGGAAEPGRAPQVFRLALPRRARVHRPRPARVVVAPDPPHYKVNPSIRREANSAAITPPAGIIGRKGHAACKAANLGYPVILYRCHPAPSCSGRPVLLARSVVRSSMTPISCKSGLRKEKSSWCAHARGRRGSHPPSSYRIPRARSENMTGRTPHDVHV